MRFSSILEQRIISATSFCQLAPRCYCYSGGSILSSDISWGPPISSAETALVRRRKRIYERCIANTSTNERLHITVADRARPCPCPRHHHHQHQQLYPSTLHTLAPPETWLEPSPSRHVLQFHFISLQYNTIKYLYSAYSHRVSRALRRRELISNVQKGRFWDSAWTNHGIMCGL